MSNNPISNVDPNGDSPMLIGAAIGFLSNGIQNIASGNNFFQGGFKAALIGAWGGGVSSGIGSAFGNVSGLGNEVLRAGAHGASGGLQSMAGGGSFGSGFLSGGISSGIGSGIGALGGGATEQWIGGGLSGGIGSVIGGGNFFQGAGMGLAIGGLNHAVDHLLSGDPTIVKTEKKNGYTINYYDDGTISTWGPGGSLSITDANGQTRFVFRASGAITSTEAPWEYLLGGKLLKDGFGIVGAKLMEKRWFRKNVFNKFPSEQGVGYQLGRLIRFHTHHTKYHGPHRQIDINIFGNWKSIRIPKK